jgi:hypothetical protein
MFVSFSHCFLPFASNAAIFEGLSLPSVRATLPVWEGHRFDLRFLRLFPADLSLIRRAEPCGDLTNCTDAGPRASKVCTTTMSCRSSFEGPACACGSQQISRPMSQMGQAHHVVRFDACGMSAAPPIPAELKRHNKSSRGATTAQNRVLIFECKYKRFLLGLRAQWMFGVLS